MDANRKTHLELIGVIALLVVLGLAVQPLLKRSGSASRLLSETSARAPAATASAAGREEPLVFAAAHELRLDTTYTAGMLRDPFQNLLPQEADARPGISTGKPLAEPPTEQPPVVTVEGLVWGGKVPHAVIDGEVYGVGDTVKGARIVAITRRGVTLEVGGATVDVAPASSESGARSEAAFQYSYHQR